MGDHWQMRTFKTGETSRNGYRQRALIVSAHYDDFADYRSPSPAGIAPSGAHCASLDQEQQQKLREGAFAASAPPTGGSN